MKKDECVYEQHRERFLLKLISYVVSWRPCSNLTPGAKLNITKDTFTHDANAMHT